MLNSVTIRQVLGEKLLQHAQGGWSLSVTKGVEHWSHNHVLREVCKLYLVLSSDQQNNWCPQVMSILYYPPLVCKIHLSIQLNTLCVYSLGGPLNSWSLDWYWEVRYHVQSDGSQKWICLLLCAIQMEASVHFGSWISLL